ncbi:hypothetical protein ASZ90_014505 [hydrocarbon metagenome]|uniref:Uncharacterized protein n=1 Tax=hydrocarbon metagenome TaxID=938273 RepID=A0A0W8F4P2_9ZZZZ
MSGASRSSLVNTAGAVPGPGCNPDNPHPQVPTQMTPR